MKLAAKLTLAVAGVAVFALALDSWMDQRRRADLLAMDVEKDWRMGRILQANVETLWRAQGLETARLLVESTDRAVPTRMIHFVVLADLPPDLQQELPASRQRQDVAWRYRPDETGSEMRFVYVPLAPHGRVEAAIMAGESLQRRDAFLRESHLRTGMVGGGLLGLSGLLAMVLGSWLVERPIGVLRTTVRALGDGRPPPPVRWNRRDELGDLASELNAVGERLAARDRLQHADRLRTIGQLASGVAHELGTPLSVIGVRARLIATGEASGAEASTNARIILEQSARMTAIVRQLLDYARRQGSQVGLLDLRHVVSGSLGMLEPLAGTRSVTIEFHPPGQPVLVRADQTQLQ